MATVFQSSYNAGSDTVELLTVVDGAVTARHSYSPSQRDSLLTDSGGEAQESVTSAGWTDAYVASVIAAESAAAFPFDQPTVLAAVAKTYRDVDEVYALVIGNRAEEYKQAETDARAYAAAGYTGTPTEYVSGWATTEGMTNQQSADAIIARADALTAAKLSLRNQRFVSQKAMLAAANRAEFDVAVSDWDAFVSATKAALA